jgi:hypothetical protein
MSPSDREREPATRKSKRDPTPEELAAIVAAVEMAWPRPVVVRVEPTGRQSAWRFSGRWWSADRPPAANRRRP